MFADQSGYIKEERIFFWQGIESLFIISRDYFLTNVQLHIDPIISWIIYHYETILRSIKTLQKSQVSLTISQS